ncbi:hypothetical protein RM572_28320 [Streptomyces sp. DSM 42041]|uniref:Integrase n=1 Tax=Streptomyces hazeniae TaxID=3075538 RepID=A0ABU2P149_9ACTN|nr:hypothetical protein [Streptomyces sp. DSM 42041]MDT0382660.1 hypothetical protein [Streptomyces sp. DSM 42041]
MKYVRPGQTYRHCDPRERIRVRIEAYTDGDARAEVVDAATGKRPRRILVKDLHESPITANGRRRRSGYVLERDSPAESALTPVPSAASVLDSSVAREILAAAGETSVEYLLRHLYAQCMEKAADIVTSYVPPVPAGPLTDGDRRLREAADELGREAARALETE